MLPLTPVTRKPGERHSVGLGSGRGEAGSGAEALLPFALPLRPNSFVIITANRVLHCNADTPEEMHHWITLLQRSKGDTRVEGQEFIVRGKRRRGALSRALLLSLPGYLQCVHFEPPSRGISTLEVAKIESVIVLFASQSTGIRPVREQCAAHPLLSLAFGSHGISVPRVAAQGSQKQPKGVLAQTEKAVVCAHPQFPGLLQELREECAEVGHPGPQQPLLGRPSGREDFQRDR